MMADPDFIRSVLQHVAPYLAEVGTSKILSLWDGPVIDGSAQRRRYGGRMSSVLRAASLGCVTRAAPNCQRNEILGAFSGMFSVAEREHLLVAFGTRRGNATSVGHFCVEAGDRDSVHVPTALKTVIANALKGKNAEVLVAHTHPPAWERRLVELLLGREPLPSEVDRGAVIAWLWPAIWMREIGARTSSMRFYVASDDKLREFRMPPAGLIAPVLAQAVRAVADAFNR